MSKQPLRDGQAEQIEVLRILLAERDGEIERLNGNLHELRDQRNDAERRVIERDQQIDRLRSSENKEIVRLKRELAAVETCDEHACEDIIKGRNKEVERLRARLTERSFPPDEREALLNALADWRIRFRAEPPPGRAEAFFAARSRLEKMRDE